MKIAIFDLDGTLSLNDHRKHHVEEPKRMFHYKETYIGPLIDDSNVELQKEVARELLEIKTWKPNWDAFFDACDKDEPNKAVVELYQTLRKSGYFMVILSGRSDKVYNKTDKWLMDNGIVWDYLMMRKEGDFRADEIIKPEMMEESIIEIKKIYKHRSEEEIRQSIQFIVDDRAKVVSKWRELGFSCFQVAEGNF